MKNILKHYFLGFLGFLVIFCLIVLFALGGDYNISQFLIIALSGSFGVFILFIFSDLIIYLLLFRNKLTYEQFIVRIISKSDKN